MRENRAVFLTRQSAFATVDFIVSCIKWKCELKPAMTEKSFDELKRDFYHGNIGERMTATTAIAELEHEGVIDILLDAIQDDDHSIRWRGAKGLTIYKDARAVPLLMIALDDENYYVCSYARDALLEHELLSIPQLVQNLDSSYKNVLTVIELIGKIALRNLEVRSDIAAQTQTTLLEMLRADSSARRQYANRTLQSLGWVPQSDEDKILSLIAAESYEMTVSYGEIAVPYLREVIGFYKAEGSDDLKTFLRELKTPLRRLLERKTRKKDAAWALLRIDSPETMQELVNFLAHPEKSVYRNAALALSTTDQSVPGLIALLPICPDKVKWRVIEVLAHIGDPRAVGPIINCLRSRDDLVQQTAMECLGKMGYPAAVPYLRQFVKDKEIGWVAERAIKQIEQNA
ncbi:MAG: HEAT repeat domain-containing protein [Chloroflexota bacterium]